MSGLRAGRWNGVGVVVTLLALGALLTVAAIASATAGRPSEHTRATVLTSTLVGPSVQSDGRRPRSLVPSTAGAEQHVSGVVESTSAVTISRAGAATYSGTEPALMTVARGPGELIVTVVPR